AKTPSGFCQARRKFTSRPAKVAPSGCNPFAPNAERPFFPAPSEMARRSTASVWAQPGNAISWCRKSSSGAVRRNAGWPILERHGRLKRSLRSIVTAGCLERMEGLARSIGRFGNQGPKRLDFRPHEICECPHPWGLLHVAMHEQVVGRRQVDIVD